MILDLKKIGNRLDSVRKDEKLTQDEISSALGISRSAYQNYIRGDRDLSASLLGKLLELYHIDPIWMIAGDQTDLILERSFSSFKKTEQIWKQVDDHLSSKGYSLDRDQIWRIVSQLFAQYVIQMSQQNSDLEITSGMIENSLGNVA